MECWLQRNASQSTDQQRRNKHFFFPTPIELTCINMLYNYFCFILEFMAFGICSSFCFGTNLIKSLITVIWLINEEKLLKIAS